MAKVVLDKSVLFVHAQSAATARSEGKTWNTVFAEAQASGFEGSLSSLQRVVKALPVAVESKTAIAPAKSIGGKPNRKITRPTGNKNTTKTTTKTANAFTPQKSTADVSSQAVETLESIHNRLPVLREGTQYVRPISLFDSEFRASWSGELNAWSHILDQQEAVRVINTNEVHPRGADILVDSTINPPGSALTVIHTTTLEYPVGTKVPVLHRWDGTAYVAIRNMEPAVSLVLANCL